MSKWMKLAFWHVFQKSKQILFSLASSKDYKLLVPKYLSWNWSVTRKCWQESNTTTSKGSTTSCFRHRKTMKLTITTISITKYQFWTPTGTTKQTKKWNSKSTPTDHTSHYWSCWEGERTDNSNWMQVLTNTSKNTYNSSKKFTPSTTNQRDTSTKSPSKKISKIKCKSCKTNSKAYQIG